jgi:mono/diheme cytochrome c family protein
VITFDRRSTRLGRVIVLGCALCAPHLAGCQQRMAEQPGQRGYEASPFFPNGQGVRPLEVGVVYRGQPAAADPMVTGLSAEGQKARGGDPSGKASFDQNSVVPPKGAPDRPENYVKEFPFEITEADLNRGQERFNINCALCHGAAGDANGKIVERGFLRPPSYHTDPESKKTDWSTMGQTSGLPQGYSRGFFRFGIKVAIKDVPVGYIFQVITWGFGGMPEHATQITPEDRWRIAAYIRALQLSQGANLADLPPDARKAAEAALNAKKSDAKMDEHGH